MWLVARDSLENTQLKDPGPLRPVQLEVTVEQVNRLGIPIEKPN